jgi:rRNA maturation endonuclease Nob1
MSDHDNVIDLWRKVPPTCQGCSMEWPDVEPGTACPHCGARTLRRPFHLPLPADAVDESATTEGTP